jgi:hypothetical protein
MATFELIAQLAILFGKATYYDKLESIFMTYLDNTADSVRMKGIEQSALLAKEFG